MAAAVVVLSAGAVVTRGESDVRANLKPASAFAGIANKDNPAIALFAEAGKVIRAWANSGGSCPMS